MKSVISADFRDRLGRLPESVRDQAYRTYALWREDDSSGGYARYRVAL